MSSKRVLKTLTIVDKFKLIKEVESGSRKKDVASKYGIPPNTVSTILKNKQSIISAVESGSACGTSKRLKKPTYENVDRATLEWFNMLRNQNLPVSGELVKEKALVFAERLGEKDFKASTGWLDNWKRRYMFAAWGLTLMGNLTPNDIVYNPLPFYHSAGGMLGIGQTLASGIPVAIRKKFSASNYWNDCAKYKCTFAQYVGEICRYILAAPQKEPVQHCLRAICGNGLRPQIWREFVEKFNIKQVYEFYGATEGISNMMNIDNTVGAVGFIPRYARWIYPVTLIKCDESTGEPLRDANGHCIECNINEAGLVIGKINRKSSILSFQGYADKKSTEKKILQNVFRNGDSYFNSGDILVSDELGNFFFKDRTGDTFRWKGENVSTSEVEAVISNLTQLKDCIVYGVEISGAEGKAGMVAIVDSNNSLDLDSLIKALKANLPPYAIPLFIRVMQSVPLTGTYKLKKVELQAEGYNVHKTADKIYFYNTAVGKYICVTKNLYEEIITGKVRL